MAVPKTGVFRRKSGNRQTIQEFGKAEFWSFCAFAEKNAVFLTNQGCKGGKSGNRQTVQEFCFAEFFSFCAFAEKNAVSLANQGCKGALAHKKPLLTKRPKPKPRIQLTLNSGKKMPVPQAKTHTKAETGKLSKNSALQNS